MTLALPVVPAGPRRTPPRAGVQIGHVRVDALTFDGAIDAIEELVGLRTGGAVFTPNVDHVVQAERHAAFREAYERASLVLADGAPVVWASRLLGRPVPAKVSGSDLIWPLARRAAQREWRVYLIGGRPGAAVEVARRFRHDCGLEVVGVDDGQIDTGDPESSAMAIERIRVAHPDLVLVALGTPKQELWIDQVRDAIVPAVAVGVGAGLDFVSGQVRRAPSWVSQAGFEWLYRLCHQPRRLWRRYLVRDPAFVLVVLRTLRHLGDNVGPTPLAGA